MADDNEYTQAILGGLRATLDYLIDRATDAELFAVQAYLSQMATQAGREALPLVPREKTCEDERERRRQYGAEVQREIYAAALQQAWRCQDHAKQEP